MELFPAIDLIDGCAVRLVKGDYAQKTIYSENPAAVARSFAAAGAKYLHVVDLEGAKALFCPWRSHAQSGNHPHDCSQKRTSG